MLAIRTSGAGNITDVGTKTTPRNDVDLIPDSAVRPSQDAEIHTGRGGAGNVNLNDAIEDQKALESYKEEDAPVGLADKLKDKLFGAFKK